MKYIDELFIDKMKLIDETQISHRDLKIFKSLLKAVSNTSFITENQGRLLLRLLRENNSIFNIEQSHLAQPDWSKQFRPVDDTRKMYLSSNNEHYQIVLEFGYSASIRKALQERFKDGKLEGFVADPNSKTYSADLTELNIVTLVDVVSGLGFIIKDTIMEYYVTIKSWDIINIKNQYRINTLSHANFQKHLTSDLGIDIPLTQNIIADRSVRYQYYIDNKEPTTLTEQIAYRNQTKIWINSDEYSLYNVFESLIELKRLPVLLIFDTHNQKKLTAQIVEMSNVLTHLDINNVGIYFRLPNNDTGKQFNEIVAERKYNTILDKNTQVIGVETNKLPKFILRNDWKPMSVIVVNTNLRNSKTAIYSTCCDLIITYDTEPGLFEFKNRWLN